MTEWIYSVHVICAAESMSGAVTALDVAFPCDDGAPRDTAHPERYGCALSVDGKEPATHYGASFSVTEEIRQRLEGLGLAQTPGVSYWRCTNPGGVLVASNQPSAPAAGTPWNFDASAAALGLQRVQTEYPGPQE